MIDEQERTLLALQRAFDQLRDPDHHVGAQLRVDLLQTTGLSAAMIEWALRSSLPDRAEVMRDALKQAPKVTTHGRTLAVILAGNIFTACIRAFAWPLLLGWRVTAKAASLDDVLPRALRVALRQVDPEVGERLDVVTFDRTDDAALRALLQGSDAVSVYGSDATIDAIGRAFDRSPRLIKHGHGVGAAFVERGAMRGRVQRMLSAQRLAIDIAAYDQRGCLSPQLVLVDVDDPKRLQKFAQNLSDALGELERTLPRGPLPADIAVAQSQWRNTMAACGEVIEGATHAVGLVDNLVDNLVDKLVDKLVDGAVEPTQMLGPGYRNVLVVACDNEPAALRALQPFGSHLKTLGIAPDGDTLTRVRANLSPTLRPTLRPTVVAVGMMQKPTFDAWTDGQPPWFGLS